MLGRKNTSLGWALFGLSLLLFAGTWAVAFVYLAVAHRLSPLPGGGTPHGRRKR